jgi:hypothetical protein
MNGKTFRVFTSLLMLVVAGVWLSRRAPGPHEREPIESPVNISDPARMIPLEASSDPSGDRTWEGAYGRPEREVALAATPEPTLQPVPDVPQDPDEARSWARLYPAEAAAWVLSAPEGPARDAVAEMVCLQLAESDPSRAIALAERFGASCTNALEGIVHQWAALDDGAAYAYASRKPPGEERDRLLGRIALVRAYADPVEAARFVAAEISPGEIQNEAGMSVLHQWALRDTNSAAAWARLFPEGALRDRAISEVETITAVPVDIGQE